MDERISLGSSGVRVSPLGVGTWAWGDRLYWAYGEEYADSDVEAAFQTSLEAGINFFDAAEVYGQGRSEELLGRFVRQTNSEVVVATKFMPSPWRLERKNLLDALQHSLKRLGMKRVDLYQIHWPFPPVSIDVWMAGLADAVEAGLTRAVGVSNYNTEQMRLGQAALAQRDVPLASNQVEYSLLHRDPERDGMMQACRELGITLIAYSPLAKGLLTGKYSPEHPPLGQRSVSRDCLAQIQGLIGLMREIGEAHGGKTPAQVSLNWLICKGAVPIPGAKNARQAQDNAGVQGWRLTDSEVAALDAASDTIEGFPKQGFPKAGEELSSAVRGRAFYSPRAET